jgi:hypothetical protein
MTLLGIALYVSFHGYLITELSYLVNELLTYLFTVLLEELSPVFRDVKHFLKTFLAEIFSDRKSSFLLSEIDHPAMFD